MLFDTYLPPSYSGSPGLEEVIVAMVERSRGRHLTNVLPLITGRGYVEFRHLSSRAFFSDPGRAVRLAEKAVALLGKPPRRKMDSRLGSVKKLADHMRNVGRAKLEDAASRMPPVELSADTWAASDAQQKAERRLLITVLELAKADPVLRGAFPWAINYPAWPIRQPGRRRSYRSPYAIACVDKDAVVAKVSAHWQSQATKNPVQDDYSGRARHGTVGEVSSLEKDNDGSAARRSVNGGGPAST